MLSSCVDSSFGNADECNRSVALAPGLLVSLSLSRWLGDVFAGRRGKVQGRKQGSMIRVLRSVLNFPPP